MSETHGERLPVEFTYRNWKGEVARRKAIFYGIWYGRNEYHKEPQYLLDGWDVEKQVWRTFALKDISWSPSACPAFTADGTSSDASSGTTSTPSPP